MSVKPIRVEIEPEILSPGQQSRGRHGARLFDNHNLDLLSHVLDDWFRIPGTSFRFGIDGIVGLIPGIGDILGGLASTVIVLAAWFRGVPYVTILRMVANVGIEVVVGMIPFFGDWFDVAWKANRRNYALLERSLNDPRKNQWGDWLYLAGIATVMLALTVLPLLVLAWLTGRVMGAGFHQSR
ncbi:DUF4112 domain-containing protein [Granulicella arctica]|uniref:DUF4112 domain-containing protein n=1 Tax=Granulicella arctica TaxID=940613 RepID=UPI0021DFA619|nr:DUF4112 domain-containing protein [Granulicella arctica]